MVARQHLCSDICAHHIVISETTTTKGSPAITSDRWHVVHSRFRSRGRGGKPFERVITSEHDDRLSCRKAARMLRDNLEIDPKVPQAQRDEVFVRKPNFKSLKTALRRSKSDE